tara:strand:+ start:445 stop:1728 length:1284 start_codon:yes stop_codon:yes gene_type:complete
MNIEFIGQGYDREAGSSVASKLMELLSDTRFSSFKCLVAFASHTGVSGLAGHITSSKSHIDSFRVIVGIDQFGTSKEALEALLQWEVDSYVFYTTQRIIFHPKIYLFEGDEFVAVIIGSNNLTQTGLAQNIEGAMLITYNKSEGHTDLINQITDYYEPLLSGESPYLKPLSTDLIEQLLASGKIKDEAHRRAQYGKDAIQEQPVGETEIEYGGTPIGELFQSLPLQGLPTGFNPTRLVSPRTARSNPPMETPTIPEQEEEESVAAMSPVAASVSGWTISSSNEVLITEIGGPARWKQISFAKRNFENFFELSTAVGATGTLDLRYLNDDGSIDTMTEVATSAKVKASRNFNLEPEKVRQSTITYSRANRPIILFIKISATQFIYHFETSGTAAYTELAVVLATESGILKRAETTVANLRTTCPSLNL